MKDLSRKVVLYCSVCGSSQFFFLDDIEGELCDASDETRIKCFDCGKEFTKGEILEANEEVINANLEDINVEMVKEFEKELARILKKWR